MLMVNERDAGTLESAGGAERGLAVHAERFLNERIAAVLPGYEVRRSQLEMMRACSALMEKGEGILLAEAGTGTGKTFSYLIPLLLSGKRAVISTRTINLQEQIVTKDLSFLSSLQEFDYAIAKGRSNYLCLRRLHAFRADEKEVVEYLALSRWASGTESGDREDFRIRHPLLWERVCSDADACMGQRCSFLRQCFYFAARQRWGRAQIVVANHALLGINALLPEDARLLPKVEVLVIDEAHSVDGALSEVAGLILSSRGFERILSTLLKPDERGTYRGLLAQTSALFPLIDSLRSEMSLFWVSVRSALKHRASLGSTFHLKERAAALAESMKALAEKARTAALGLFHEDDELELKAALLKLKSYAQGMEEFSEGCDGYVRWAEIEEGRVSLRMAPVYPADFMQNSIVPEFGAMVLTSATLSVAGDFDVTARVLGLEGASTLSVPSPFDLREQVVVEVKRGIDPAGSDSAEKIARVIVEEVSKRDGGVLVLFTSKEMMGRVEALSAAQLSALGLNPLIQGEIPNRAMLERMRESSDCILFGLDSFWEGVDVKGDALKCVIITKLPFEVPTEPIVQARTREIEGRGGNSFREYSLPRAVLKFKQGFGRLIRSKEDKGRVVICDERVCTRSYGLAFLEAVYRDSFPHAGTHASRRPRYF
ncbi:MAG: ATP-dependent DNA helicase [Alphaproteobacteria bacterium]|uniref:ATP-dependent DNA helicase n=1 Tax=Candidatus Nitrobium versatile TaxID=2884831 RepID=A0A953LZ85_9BACT|nr:ATP-dependent DNA helicase [Candidatus Nitrobium versatile]